MVLECHDKLRFAARRHQSLNSSAKKLKTTRIAAAIVNKRLNMSIVGTLMTPISSKIVRQYALRGSYRPRVPNAHSDDELQMIGSRKLYQI